MKEQDRSRRKTRTTVVHSVCRAAQVHTSLFSHREKSPHSIKSFVWLSSISSFALTQQQVASRVIVQSSRLWRLLITGATTRDEKGRCSLSSRFSTPPQRYPQVHHRLDDVLGLRIPERPLDVGAVPEGETRVVSERFGRSTRGTKLTSSVPSLDQSQPSCSWSTLDQIQTPPPCHPPQSAPSHPRCLAPTPSQLECPSQPLDPSAPSLPYSCRPSPDPQSDLG